MHRPVEFSHSVSPDEWKGAIMNKESKSYVNNRTLSSNYFFLSLKKFKICWKSKTPYEKWKFFYKFCEFWGEIMQMNVFGNLKIGIIGYFPCFTGVIHYSLLIYTVYYYINCGYFIGCLPGFCIFGAVTSVNTIIFIFMRILWNNFFLKKIYVGLLFVCNCYN